ncbi:MAG: hypothetical protein JOZ80_09270 [Acidobacteriaceae bacterium]|nr:hypothetical protein [Acidobacteriaceae bacterium]
MNSSEPLSELASQWRDARSLYPLYAALAREFVIELPPCHDLEAGVEAPPRDSIEQTRQWFLDVDERIQVHQLRQFLQTTPLNSEEALRNLLMHHLHKQKHTDADRDKVDFLLVQYFSNCATSGLQDADIDLQYVAQVLEPVLGAVDVPVPEGLALADQLVEEASACKDLNELFTSQILEKGRKLKASVGDSYFVPVAMVAFARFSFLLRRIFFRLMHQDLNGILDGLRELESRGVSNLDCRRAQFSAEEPIARLRMICQSWKVMFHAEYSSGQPLRMLADLRTVVDAALSRSGKASRAPAARGAAAGVNGQASDISEHAVDSGPDES